MNTLQKAIRLLTLRERRRGFLVLVLGEALLDGADGEAWLALLARRTN